MGKVVGSGISGNFDFDFICLINFDVNIEWYFVLWVFVLMGVFYMNIGSYIMDGMQCVMVFIDVMFVGG